MVAALPRQVQRPHPYGYQAWCVECDLVFLQRTLWIEARLDAVEHDMRYHSPVVLIPWPLI